MKTAAEIAAEAARKVLNDNRDNLSEDYHPEGEPLGQLGWEVGAGITYEDALSQIVIAAIEADRAQRKIVNWDGAGQLIQAYYEAQEGFSGDAEHEAAMEVVSWVECALAGSAR